METYYRKRTKRGTSANNDIVTLKRKEVCSVVDGTQLEQAPLLDRQILHDPNDEVALEDVEQDSVYEIYHKNLPPRTPIQLKSTRVAMVSEKTNLNVTIRYPSSLSLKRYFSKDMEMYSPDFDEKFVMGLKLASKVLYRQVSSDEFDANKDLEEFWLVESTSETESTMKNDDIGLARELKNNELKWGITKKILGQHRRTITPCTQDLSKDDDHTLIKKHNETSNCTSTLGCQQEDEGDEIREDEEEVDHETEQEEDEDEAKEVEEEEDEDYEKEQKSTRILRKRKKTKQVKNVWHQVIKKPMKKCKKFVINNPTDRWSKNRYNAAELTLLESLQEKKATIHNPITRPELRAEARKRIGDTGLLDHLLKHMANKLAPCGKLRFRRSYNVDGLMQYWLEDADLIEIRIDAGVNDPFWTPPPGWKLGDPPTQDPLMAKELNQLKEDLSFIKREEYVPKKQYEEEIAGLRREIQELTLQNKQEQSQSRVVSEVVDTSPLQNICNFLPHFESDTSDVDNSVLKREQCNKLLVVISDIQKKIEAWMQATDTGQPAKSPKADTLLITATTASSNATKMPKLADEINKVIAPAPPKQPAGVVHQDKSEKSGHLSPPPPATQTQTPTPSPPERKAAFIERLKSGFKRCRPQATFLWPNMVGPTNSTPPSINSSTTPPLQPHHHHRHLNLASPPVKPVPEIHPVPVSSLSEGHPPPPTTTFLNLNDIPNTTITPAIKLKLPFEANQPATGSKKRKSPSSATFGSSDTPSCLSS